MLSLFVILKSYNSLPLFFFSTVIGTQDALARLFTDKTTGLAIVHVANSSMINTTLTPSLISY